MSHSLRLTTVAELVGAAPDFAAKDGRLYMADDGSARLHFNGIDYHSVYQGIRDTASTPPADRAALPASSCKGAEIGLQGALQRVDVHTLPATPIERLMPLADAPQLVGLDRLTRMLHAINFFGAGHTGLLFLNVHEQLLKSVKYDHGRHFSAALLALGLNPARVVVELPETALAHRGFVDYLIKSYQGYGFKVAGNLHHCGQIASNPHLGRFDFIKIDANKVLHEYMARALIHYAARLKIPLIFKRVDDAGQLRMLQQFPVRFMQGSLFAPSLTAQ
jgi:EAL domain-containing protein (putative c-di-GMP-specific phosphodiesterase class I)